MPPADDTPTFVDLTPALTIVAVDDDPLDEHPLTGGGRYPVGAAILIGVVVLVTIVVVLTLVGGVSDRNTDNGLPFNAPTAGPPSLGTYGAVPPPVVARPSPSPGRPRAAAPSAPPAAVPPATKKSPSPATAGAFGAPADPIAPGSLVGAGDKCAQVQALGGQVELDDCDGSTAQHWTLPGDGTFRAQGGCLDVPDGPTTGTPVQVNPCDATSSQHWDLRGDETLFNGFANRCASVDGSKLVLADCRVAPEQTWRLA
jgi:hypothetical protein